MHKCKITVLKRHVFSDLAEDYAIGGEIPPCPFFKDDYSITLNANDYNSLRIPDGFCSQAWDCISHYVYAAVSCGKINDAEWMKDPQIYLASCNDGLRPVVFKIEAIEE